MISNMPFSFLLLSGVSCNTFDKNLPEQKLSPEGRDKKKKKKFNFFTIKDASEITPTDLERPH